MASLHPAAGAPAAFDPRSAFAFATTHNPFLKSEAVSPALQLLNQNAPAAESVEVTVLWGDNVLSVSQLTPPRKYAVGEVGGPGGAGTSAAGDVDFALSADRLGSARREIVAMRSGSAFAVFAADEKPRVFEKGQAVDASAAIVDCSDVARGALGIELRQDRIVIVEASGVTFRLAGSEKTERIARAKLGGADRSAVVTMSGAALLQGLLVASLAYFTPSLAWGEDEDMNRDRMLLMQQYLHASAEREQPEQPQIEQGGGEKGAPAERNRGPEGAAGTPTTKQHARMAIQGDRAERVVSRAEMIKEATDFGTIGLLNTLNASNAPSSPWGADLQSGMDNVSAVGDMFSATIGEGAGNGGLGLSGLGLGGGGKGLGVGMGNIGTCMGLNCYGNGKDGFGRSGAITGRDHVTRAPRMQGHTELVSGHLPPEVIQRVVRQNFGRFRSCYEMGLRGNPNLEGRVTARFVIGRDGAVSNVSAGGDLPDPSVRSCVASAFYALSFPAPDAGIVTVTYPIMLQPG
jgi:hypothetical protein